jgi:hypothetical protein
MLSSGEGTLPLPFSFSEVEGAPGYAPSFGPEALRKKYPLPCCVTTWYKFILPSGIECNGGENKLYSTFAQAKYEKAWRFLSKRKERLIL